MGSETKREPDFSGYVTKAGIVCTDGRMIDAGAFAHQTGQKVPFVWQHGHKDVENVLGHVLLEERDASHPGGAGTYGYVYCNSTPKGQHAKTTVQDGDLNAMSIWANELKEKIAGGIKHVLGGGIKEVSLALAGANSGAKIDNIRIAHSDNPDDPDDPMAIETRQDEAFIVVGAPLEHESPNDDSEELPVVELEGAEEVVAPEGTEEVVESDAEVVESDAEVEHSDNLEHANPKDDRGNGPDAAWLIKSNVNDLKQRIVNKAIVGWMIPEVGRLQKKYKLGNGSIGDNPAALNEFMNEAMSRFNSAAGEIGVSPSGTYKLVAKRGTGDAVFASVTGGDPKNHFDTAPSNLLQHDAVEGDGEDILEHATGQEIWDSLNADQEAFVRALIGDVIDNNSAEHSDEVNEGDLIHTTEGNQEMTTRNVFETQNPGKSVSLQHSGLDLEKRWDGDTVKDLLHSAMGDPRIQGSGVGSLRQHLTQAAGAHLGHDVDYGIENIDYLFPDAKNVQDSPEFIKRRTDWVDGVLTGVKHSPFSRVKTYFADITADEARAKGYTKGTLKKDEWFTLSKRVTTPATIYKKQKLDRDDILDITDMDVVAWMKQEMRIMLDEEVARAILIGDGREVDDDDKIKEPSTSGDGAGIRPIAFDDDAYTHKVITAASSTVEDKVEAILRARKYYKGSGNPTFYTTDDTLSDFLLEKDRMGRRLYPTEADVAAALRVKNIVTVEVMDSVQTDDGELVGIIVNLIDYTVGADKGAAIGLFDDFDIDYNQYKYLMETRISGSLTRYKAAIAVLRANGTEATPAVPTFVTGTGVLTVPSTTGVVYKNDETNATLSAGAQTAIASGATVYVRAYPATGYYFPHNFDATWSYTRS